jgi:hypothetical protein
MTRLLIPCLGLIALTSLSGCNLFGPPASEQGFDSPDPAARLYAIERAARENDLTKFPELVDSLEHEDPAVRLLAIATLRRMTNQDLGYDASGTPGERAAAVARWREWVRVHPGP